MLDLAKQEVKKAYNKAIVDKPTMILTDIQMVEWLIEQAEMIEKIKKLSNAEDITLADFAKETLKIIECRETPTRKERS
ncbi:hypothetical protein [Bacillus sp. FJAT-49736]|uniref:hypothetical protein n=1 Tax=Bacillus sp. FJAT-49736 TaxID=2833582 RepID=UPI001BC8DA96|nr:hypothetical protein [Bacillus sp. FJAT-49736]MBS4173503.1 hypothetical protein [Bacillus sp. FJAT-49736]